MVNMPSPSTPAWDGNNVLHLAQPYPRSDALTCTDTISIIQIPARHVFGLMVSCTEAYWASLGPKGSTSAESETRFDGLG